MEEPNPKWVINLSGKHLTPAQRSVLAKGPKFVVTPKHPKLIAYASKRMPEVAKNYSITELEICGLAITIASFAYLLKKVDFNVTVDHLAITHIMRSKAEPTTTRIKRLLELLSGYSFNLYYIKEKNMVLIDFLSRQKSDNSNPHEIISISFSIRNVLHESYYRLGNLKNLLTRSAQSKENFGSSYEARKPY